VLAPFALILFAADQSWCLKPAAEIISDVTLAGSLFKVLSLS